METKPKFNEDLRKQLLDLRADATEGANYSNTRVATAMGTSSSYVSQYCTGKSFPGDLEVFESKLAAFLRIDSRRRLTGLDTIQTAESEQIKKALLYIQDTRDMGVIKGHSGEGKTRGIEWFAKTDPTCIIYHVRSWSRDLNSIEAALFDAIGSAGWDKRTKRAAFMLEKLRGSGRLLIVDDAHKLTKPALQWLFDFHDASGTPIALVGTHQIDKLLVEDTQRFSRTGYSLSIKSKSQRMLIEHIVTRMAPDVKEGELSEVCDLCEQICGHDGRYRAVQKQIKLALEIQARKKEKGEAKDLPASIRLAQRNLIRNWELN